MPVNTTKIYAKSVQSFKGTDITDVLARGDKALNENRNEEALQLYKEAAQKAPDNSNVYAKLAKAQFKLKDYAGAQADYTKYLEAYPDDVDCLIELGETQRLSGYYQKALGNFQKAASLQPGNDLANRNILQTKNDIVHIYNPVRAESEKREYAAKNLKAALDMTVKYMSPEFMSDLNDVTVQFGETASMSGTSNIAQYEDAKKSITVSDSYIYAAPQVIAAYLTHETVHAKDKDGYTSVYEEQDAYKIATDFWIKNSGGIKDPEMDYAADLYKQSPETLDKRVDEIYTLRDASISRTSPNHPPKKFFSPFVRKTSAAAGQPLKHYDIIA